MNALASKGTWVARPLIEVATLQRGYDLPVQDRTDGLHPKFAANGTVGFHAQAKCKGPGVVTGRSGTIGKVHFVDCDYWPLNTALYVKDFHGNDPKWVYYMLQSFGLEHFAQGAGVPTLNRNLIHGEIIRVPPVREQCRIAAILDQADALRAKRMEALAQLDSLAQSIFIEMLGDPLTNPMGWTYCSLSELGKPVTGNTPSRAVPGYYGNAVEWIKSDNINTPHYYLTAASEGLSESGKLVGRTVRPLSILMTCIAGSPDCIGNSAMTDREVAFNQQINAFIPLTIEPHFAYAQFIVGKRMFQDSSTNGMKGMVSKSRFEQIKVVNPPLPLQESFSEGVQTVESLKGTQYAALQELDRLFASLKHRSFQGEL